MKKIILIVSALIFIRVFSYAQYWDWVTDEKSMQAFGENYLSGQMVKMAEYLAKLEVIKKQQQEIAEKATFIHMVRDSLFKSLQDVEGITNESDERIIRKVFGQIEAYYSEIEHYISKHSDFRESWTQYDNYVKIHSRQLLKFAEMATKGKDEKNLLDKEQRLFLLNYVLFKLKDLRQMSKWTHEELIIGDANKVFTIEVVYKDADRIFSKRAN